MHEFKGEAVPWTLKAAHLHVSSPPSEAQQLLVLAGDEVDGGVLEQGREHKQQTDGHPDIDGFYVRHLLVEMRKKRPSEGLCASCLTC